ncbi:MAG: hypothetical protein QOF89_3559 [Acidobacteriota bacterium]|jgi:M6 family metalloprotease-like protein|nr:hypothetical protein [Acidobacteriota bacterium]
MDILCLRFRRLAVIATVGVCALQLSAATPVTAQQSKYQSSKPIARFYEQNGRNWVVRWSPDGQRVTSLLGSGTRPYQGKPAEAARQFLGEWAQLFGLRPDLEDLKVIDDRAHLGGASAEFQQVVDGVSVENGHVQVNLDKGGRVLMVENSYWPSGSAPPAAVVPRERATAIAIERLAAIESARRPGWSGQKPHSVTSAEVRLSKAPAVEETYFGTEQGLVRAYRIIIHAETPFAIREFIVDSRTGEILHSRNYVQDMDGTGQVFIPNPNASLNDNTVTPLTLTNNNPNPYFTVPLLNLDPASGGVFHLNGPFVTLENIESPSNTPTSEASADAFVYNAGDLRFADVMVYYHLDRVQRYIQSLGFVDVNNRQIHVDPRGVSDDFNAHYLADPTNPAFPPGLGYLAFGMFGSNFFAEDGNVVAHEYGHAVQDNQTNGKYSVNGQPAAMGEGFGDYLSVTAFFNEATTAGSNPACVGQWVGGGPCFRRADTTMTMDNYNFSPFADPHTNGQIWSRALWDILNSIGRTTADRLILRSHFNVPNAPSFKQGADAILTADLQLYAGSHLSQLCQPFIDRKIYTAADCPTVPGSTGMQSTLVVLARFNDAGLPASPISVAGVTNRINLINNYLSAVTFGQASLGTPTIVGWLNLPHSRADYYNDSTSNMLIQLAQDVIAAAPAGTDFTTVDRMIILTNDDGFGGETRGLKEWATTGPWPYTLPAAFGTRRMSVSIHRSDQDDAHFNHAIGHHFGLGDLYPHEGVAFPRKYANGWSGMAQTADATTFPNTHVFAWEKGRPGWMTNANVQFVARPTPGGSFDQTFPLFREESNAASPIALQVGTTNGVTARANERVSYYLEARKQSADSFDAHLPQDGVVIYYANEDIGQGFGPARVVDATPADDDLTNAAWQPGSTATNIDGSGLTVQVLAPMGSEDYRVRVQYNPPSDQVDVWINPHDSSWRSPDIWIDSPGCNSGTCGFDKDASPPREETDRGDKPIAGQVNRAYARVYNHGPGTAHDVRVDFYFSDPYHGIDGGDVDPETGGNTAFNKHQFVIIPDLPPTDTGVAVSVEWTPVQPPDADHPHACVKVKIQQVTGDTNGANQASQENIDSYDISSHSPYPPVVDAFRVVNPYDHPLMVFLRPDNVPAGWTATIAPEKAYLPVGGSVDAAMTIQAPLTYPVCTSELITATAWYPSGDTLVQLGGSTAQVNLKKSTALTATPAYEPCRQHQDVESEKSCSGIDVKGCTNPPRPFEHITARYTAPDGTTVYHDVVTDANGCYEDFYVVPQGGPWKVDVDYQGDDCTSVTHARPTVVIVPPNGQGGFGPLPSGAFWYSFHLGMGFPIGSFKREYQPGPSLALDLERFYSDTNALAALLGFHSFHGRFGPDLSLATLNFDLKHYFPVGALTGFAQLGPGLYRPSGGPTTAGTNAGLGLHFTVLPALALEVGSDLHVFNSNQGRLFVDAHLGMTWRP